MADAPTNAPKSFDDVSDEHFKYTMDTMAESVEGFVKMVNDTPAAPTFEALLGEYDDAFLVGGERLNKANATLLAHVAEKDALVASLRSLVRVQEEAIAKRDHDKEVLSAVITAAAEAHEAASQNACIVPDGIVGDESGTPYCTMKSRAEKAEAALAERDKRIAELEALVDALQQAGELGNRALVAAREKVAAWMIRHGFATGPGDTLDDLLGELSWQVEERRKSAAEARNKALDEAATEIRSHDPYIGGTNEIANIILALKKETHDAG